MSRILTTTLTQTYTAYNTTPTPTLTPKPAADSTTAIQSSSTSTSSVKPSASYTASDVTQWQTLIDSYCRYLALLYHYYYTSAKDNNNINININKSNSNTSNSNNNCNNNNNITDSNSRTVSDGLKPENSVLLVQSGTVILSIVSFLMNAVSCDISIPYNTITTTHTNSTNSNNSGSNRVVSYNDLDTIVNHVVSLLINHNSKQGSLSDVRSTRITINRYYSSVLLLVFSSMSVWENNASFCHNSDLFEKVCYTHILLYIVHYMYIICTLYVLYCIV